MSYILKHVYDDSNMTFMEQIKTEKILSMYNLNIINIEKVRSVYKIHSDNGTFCLKEISKDEKKAMKSIKLIECLKDKGFHNIASPYCSNTGSYIVKTKESSYYLTDWIDAREVDFNDTKHIFESTKLLAEFHNKAKGFNLNDIKIKNHIGKWHTVFMNKINFLNDIKEKLLLNPSIRDFDKIYCSNIDYYIKEAQFAMHILKHSEYENISKFYSKVGQVCHNSFYYQNILSDINNNYYLIDLESCVYDMPLRDIGKFIIRIMDKKENLWNFQLCKDILASYNSVRAIGESEYKILLSLIIFPYKFYKIGRKKYIKRKKWKEDRFYRKLKKVNETQEEKKEFICKFINYYNINI